MKKFTLLLGFLFLAAALTWAQSTTQTAPSGQPQGSAASTATLSAAPARLRFKIRERRLPFRQPLFFVESGIHRFAQDFACGLPLRLRPQSGSTSKPSSVARPFAALAGIGARDRRCAGR